MALVAHVVIDICTFLQNFMALSLSVFELCWLKKKKKKKKKEEKKNKTPYHSPIHL